MIEFIKKSEKDNVILFVHGFIGGRETWFDEGNPRNFVKYLQDDEYVSANYDLAIFNYFTKISDIKEDIGWISNLIGRKRKIKKNLATGEIANLLKSHVEINLDRYKGVVLIAHSMGGLVSKHFILDSMSKAVKLFVSLSVPHNGSNLADLGKIIVNNPQVKDLAPLEKNINDLNNRWIKSKTLPPTVYHQGLYDRVVPPTSSIGLDSRDVKVIYSDDDHFSILSPESKDDVVIQSILRQLKTALIITTPNNSSNASEDLSQKLQPYRDSRLGFSLSLPDGIKLDKPQYVSQKELIKKVGMNDVIDDDVIDFMMVNHPFGNMLIKAESIIFQLGEDIKVDYLDNTSSEEVEEYLTRKNQYLEFNNQNPFDEEQMKIERKDRFTGGIDIKGFNFPVMLGVSVLDKKDAISSVQKPNLPNLLRVFLMTPEPIEEIFISNDRKSVSWNTRVKILNAKVLGKVADFTIFRANKLVESDDKIYQLQLQWSPESKSVIKVYNQLELMLNSFKIESNQFQ